MNAANQARGQLSTGLVEPIRRPKQGETEMKTRRWIIAAIAMAGLAGLLGSGTAPAKADGKIVIYAAEDEKTLGALTKLFTEKTGIQTEAIRIPAAGTLVARIRAEKDAPKADVFIGGSIEFHQPLAEDGLVIPY